MSKFFVSKAQINNVNDEKNNCKQAQITIIGTDVNHIKNVLRYGVGRQLEICCKEDSKNYTCEIVEIESDKIICKILEESTDGQNGTSTESNIVLDVYQGLPKYEKMELIIQKGTELGAHSFIPVKMKRSIVKLNEKDSAKKVERWNKISEVAAKQALRDMVPLVETPITIKDLSNRISDYDIAILAYEEEKDNYIKNELNSLKTRVDNKSKDKDKCADRLKVAIIIGPEGGLDIEEVKILKESGAKVVSLGKRILRTETASMQLTSIIMYELENN